MGPKIDGKQSIALKVKTRCEEIKVKVRNIHDQFRNKGSLIKDVLHSDLNVSFERSIQLMVNLFVTNCTLFDRQLKPIFVTLDLVNKIPGLLSLCNTFRVRRLTKSCGFCVIIV